MTFAEGACEARSRREEKVDAWPSSTTTHAEIVHNPPLPCGWRRDGPMALSLLLYDTKHRLVVASRPRPVALATNVTVDLRGSVIMRTFGVSPLYACDFFERTVLTHLDSVVFFNKSSVVRRTFSVNSVNGVATFIPRLPNCGQYAESFRRAGLLFSPRSQRSGRKSPVALVRDQCLEHSCSAETVHS